MSKFILSALPTMPALITVEGNYKIVAMPSYLAQFNKMLKYKNVKFLHTFCKEVRAFAHFYRIFATFCALLYPFFDVFFLPYLPKPPMLPFDIYL